MTSEHSSGRIAGLVFGLMVGLFLTIGGLVELKHADYARGIPTAVLAAVLVLSSTIGLRFRLDPLNLVLRIFANAVSTGEGEAENSHASGHRQ